jgi:hypothetical protein
VPDDDAAIEYWTLVARLPARHSEGVSQLKKLNASAPGNAACRRRWRTDVCR